MATVRAESSRDGKVWIDGAEDVFGYHRVRIDKGEGGTTIQWWTLPEVDAFLSTGVMPRYATPIPTKSESAPTDCPKCAASREETRRMAETLQKALDTIRDLAGKLASRAPST